MAKRKFSLDALKSAFDSDKKGGSYGKSSKGKFFSFPSMEYDDSCTIRFLPDLNEKNDKAFLIDKKMHEFEVNGTKERIPCLTMWDEECPACEVSRGFYKDEDKVNGKKYYRKLTHIAQVLVKEDPIKYDDGGTCAGTVKAVNIGYQIFKILENGFEDLEEVPFDFDEGTDFVITRSKKGDWADYTVGTKFVRRESALTEEELEIVEEGMEDLSVYLPEKPDRKVLEAKLHASLAGEVYDPSDAGDDEEEEEEAPVRKPRTTKKVTKPIVEEVEEEDEDEEEEEVEAPKRPARRKIVEEKEEEVEADEDESDDDDSDDDDDAEGNAVLARIRARRNKARG